MSTLVIVTLWLELSLLHSLSELYLEISDPRRNKSYVHALITLITHAFLRLLPLYLMIKETGLGRSKAYRDKCRDKGS